MLTLMVYHYLVCQLNTIHNFTYAKTVILFYYYPISISSDSDLGIEVSSLLLDGSLGGLGDWEWVVQSLGFNLKDVIVVDISGKWVKLVDHGIILWSVGKVILTELN